MTLLLAFALTLSVVAPEPYYLDQEEEFFPAAFRGIWAPNLAACKAESGEDIIRVGRTKIWFYEADAKLLKLTPENHLTAPDGKDSVTIVALVAERAEAETGIAKLRLTVAGTKLYTSRVDAVPEEQQWQYGNVRCPS